MESLSEGAAAGRRCSGKRPIRSGSPGTPWRVVGGGGTGSVPKRHDVLQTHRTLWIPGNCTSGWRGPRSTRQQEAVLTTLSPQGSPEDGAPCWVLCSAGPASAPRKRCLLSWAPTVGSPPHPSVGGRGGKDEHQAPHLSFDFRERPRKRDAQPPAAGQSSASLQRCVWGRDGGASPQFSPGGPPNHLPREKRLTS